MVFLLVLLIIYKFSLLRAPYLLIPSSPSKSLIPFFCSHEHFISLFLFLTSNQLFLPRFYLWLNFAERVIFLFTSNYSFLTYAIFLLCQGNTFCLQEFKTAILIQSACVHVCVLYMCIQVCGICMCMYVYMIYAPMYVCRGQRKASGVLLCYSLPYSFDIESLTEPGTPSLC